MIIGHELIIQFKNDIANSQNVLKDIFYKLMTSTKEIIVQAIISHKKNLQLLCEQFQIIISVDKTTKII